MLRPSHAAPQYSASEVFTDREDARERFERALEDDQGVDDYRVLVWYGVGGQGKSALQAEFGRMVDRRRGAWVNVRKRAIGQALLDLELIERRSPVQAMLTLRLQLGDSAGIAFPAFDTAFARYFALDNPGKDIRAVHPQLFQSGGSVLADVLSLASDAAAIIPGYGLLTKYGSKLVAAGAEKLHDWWRLRGVEVLKGLDDLGQDALAARLPSYLGADLCDAVRRPSPPRIVLRIDTHEALWRERGLKDGPGALLADDWVRRLVQDAPGVLVVLTGRDRLRWEEIEPGWSTVLEQHLLGGLSAQDAEVFLEKVGVDDVEVRRTIARAAGSDEGGGCLPYFLDLEKDTWHAIRAAGQTPAPEDFGGTRTEILARFLNHLDPETERVLHLASYAEALHPNLLRIVARAEGDAGAPPPDWGKVTGRAFVERTPGGQPVLHLLMREALQAQEKAAAPERYHRIHHYLMAAYSSLVPKDAEAIADEHARWLLGAIPHGLAAPTERFHDWAAGALSLFNRAGRWRVVEEAARALGPRYDYFLNVALDGQGRFEEARDLSEALLTYAIDTFGPDHPDTGVTWVNLGRAYDSLGEFRSALDCCERGLAIATDALGDGHRSVRIALGSLGQVLLNLGRHAEADAATERLRDLILKSGGGESVEMTEALNALAITRQRTGRPIEAEALFDASIEMMERLDGVARLGLPAALGNRAILLRETGRLQEADAAFEQVRALEDALFEPGHPYVAQTLYQHARTLSELGRFEEAEALFERAADILRNGGREATARWSRLLSHRADLYERQGRLAEARADVEAALKGFEAAGVEDAQTTYREARERKARLDGDRTA